MSPAGEPDALAGVYRRERRRVLATLIRLLGDFDEAEEAMHDAFAAAAAAWPKHGVRYHLAHAARADLQRRLGQDDASRASYERALELTEQPAERRFLEKRLERRREEPGHVR